MSGSDTRLGLQPWALTRQGGGGVRQGGRHAAGANRRQHEPQCLAHVGLEGEVSVIATGKLADIVICNSDPVADIIVLQRPSQISTIIKGGRIIDSGTGGFRQLPHEPPGARASISS